MVAVEAALDPSLVLRRDARDALQRGDLDTALRLFDSVVAQLGSGDAQHLADARCERGVVLSRRAATQADGKAKERDLRAALSDCPQQRVLIEALACGCPIVSTDCPHGPAEILARGKFGRLVPVGDGAALAEALAATLDDPPSRDLLRARGAEFTIERAVDAYLDLLGQGPAATA